jgi:hypothetical protein
MAKLLPHFETSIFELREDIQIQRIASCQTLQSPETGCGFETGLGFQNVSKWE